jgi:hypothetical protein
MSDFGVVEIDDACTILSDLIDAGRLDYAEPAAGQLGAATHAEGGGRVFVLRSDDRLVTPSDLVAWLRRLVSAPMGVSRRECAPHIDPSRLYPLIDHHYAGPILDQAMPLKVYPPTARLLLPLVGWWEVQPEAEECFAFSSPQGRVRLGFLPDGRCSPRGLSEYATARILREIDAEIAAVVIEIG